MNKLNLFFIIVLMGTLISYISSAQSTIRGIPVVADENTVLLDHFDSTATGEIVGTVRYVPSVQGLSTAIDFSNPTNYLIYKNSTELESAGTIEMWIKPKMIFHGLLTIMRDRTFSSYPNTFILQLGINYRGKIELSNQGNLGTSVFRSNSPIALNKWTHIAVSWGDSTRIYINGKPDMISADPFRPAITQSNSFIYIPYWGNGIGLFDELHISKVQRTNAEIASRIQYITIIKEVNVIARTHPMNSDSQN